MVGKEIGVFFTIEVKTLGDTVKPEQIDFMSAIKSMGGFAGISREPDHINNIKEILNL